MTSGCWAQTLTGKAVSFLTPQPEDICLEDIAISLSRLPRFTGHTRVAYSVAQHSLHVMQIVKDVSPTDYAAHIWALLHDAHEFVTNDVNTPFQQAICYEIPTGWPNPIKRIQDRLDRVIAEAFGIDWRDVEAVKPLVKRADLIALATEKAQQMAPEPQPWIELPLPCDVELVPVGSVQAEFLFKLAFERAIGNYRARKISSAIAAE